MKLDRTQARRIVTLLEKRLVESGDPRAFGGPLAGEWTGFWRYRIDDYRVSVKINDDIVTVFVIRIAHRSQVYK